MNGDGSLKSLESVISEPITARSEVASAARVNECVILQRTDEESSDVRSMEEERRVASQKD